MAEAVETDAAVTELQRQLAKEKTEHADTHNALCRLMLRIEELDQGEVLNIADVVDPDMRTWWKNRLRRAKLDADAGDEKQRVSKMRRDTLQSLTAEQRRALGLPDPMGAGRYNWEARVALPKT